MKYILLGIVIVFLSGCSFLKRGYDAAIYDMLEIVEDEDIKEEMFNEIKLWNESKNTRELDFEVQYDKEFDEYNYVVGGDIVFSREFVQMRIQEFKNGISISN